MKHCYECQKCGAVLSWKTPLEQCPKCDHPITDADRPACQPLTEDEVFAPEEAGDGVHT